MGGLLVLLAGPWCVSSGAAEDPLTDDKVVMRTEGAHRLLLPKDWPVEHRDGVIAPVPVEEYLAMKLDQVRAKFDAVEARLEALTQRLERWEVVQRAMERRLQQLEAQPSVSP